MLFAHTAWADNSKYAVEIEAPSELASLLKQHLEIMRWLDNPRMNSNEWHRLLKISPRAIEDLLATEGYFAPRIEQQLSDSNGVSTARFIITPGSATSIKSVDIGFTGAIRQQAENSNPNPEQLRENWQLPTGVRFTQDAWSRAKRSLLSSLLLERYPTASIADSEALIDAQASSATLSLQVDSGPEFFFGDLEIEGLQRYPSRVVRNLNPIAPGTPYSQAALFKYQADLQATDYFTSTQVTAKTDTDNPAATPIVVRVVEQPAVTVGVGVGASTNTGARVQLNYKNRNLLDRGWRLDSSLKLEQRAQSLSAVTQLPVTRDGYRDSINNHLLRLSIEGQTTTSFNNGVKRAWGPRTFEQSVGANYLVENLQVDGQRAETKKAGTLSYGITIRRLDNDIAPTKGFLFNVQVAGAPLESLSDGRFLQTYSKAQGYYPLGKSTQLIGRLEGGVVNGGNSVPATFLFRAGGDQSVRGYAFQSLGVKEGNAITGGRYLVTGSMEIIQWLTERWGAAAFVDFGDAAASMRELNPVYGYGLGARFKSPAGGIGVDIAYGEATGDIRLHFNLGVSF
ncbi:MAG: autotransporter assembly complex family protein [Methylophilaceae bacterium]